MWPTLILSTALLLIATIGAVVMATRRSARPSRTGGGVRVTGACGDTMMLELTIARDRVVASRPHTDGCAFSRVCLAAAAELAAGKTIADILAIDADQIEARLGGLPHDHRHCAALAAAALTAAAEQHRKNERIHRAVSEQACTR